MEAIKRSWQHFKDETPLRKLSGQEIVDNVLFHWVVFIPAVVIMVGVVWCIWEAIK